MMRVRSTHVVSDALRGPRGVQLCSRAQPEPGQSNRVQMLDSGHLIEEQFSPAGRFARTGDSAAALSNASGRVQLSIRFPKRYRLLPVTSLPETAWLHQRRSDRLGGSPTSRRRTTWALLSGTDGGEHWTSTTGIAGVSTLTPDGYELGHCASSEAGLRCVGPALTRLAFVLR
jgi:hypothetical protein